jgi:hypothetical protein
MMEMMSGYRVVEGFDELLEEGTKNVWTRLDELEHGDDDGVIDGMVGVGFEFLPESLEVNEGIFKEIKAIHVIGELIDPSLLELLYEEYLSKLELFLLNE